MSMKALICVLLAASVLCADEQAVGFGDVLSQIFQQMEAPQASSPVQSFEIEIVEIVDPNQGPNQGPHSSQPIDLHRLGGKGGKRGKGGKGGKRGKGGKGSKGGIFGQMLERMRHMHGPMVSPMAPDAPHTDSPISSFLQHIILNKMKRQHSQLLRACAEEVHACPGADSSVYGPGVSQCLLSQPLGDLSEACGDKLHAVQGAHQRIARKVHAKHTRLLHRMRKVCAQEKQFALCSSHEPSFFASQGSLDAQLACMVKAKARITGARCQHLVHKTASRWGRFEALAAHKALISTELQQHCAAEVLAQGCAAGGAFRRLKCLAKHAAALSAPCKAVVSSELSVMLAQKQAHKQVRQAHRQCGAAFRQTAQVCGHNDRVCLNQAKRQRRACHRAVRSDLTVTTPPVTTPPVTTPPAVPRWEEEEPTGAASPSAQSTEGWGAWVSQAVQHNKELAVLGGLLAIALAVAVYVASARREDSKALEEHMALVTMGQPQEQL